AHKMRKAHIPARGAAHTTGLPPPRLWGDKSPDAASRVEAVKRIVRTRALALDVPQENLLTPEFQRRLAWEPPEPASDDHVAARLTELGARPWQVTQLAGLLADAVGRPDHVIETLPDPLAK